jgi:hypothetical protein
MSPEGLALLWFAAINLVWALIFTGVVIFALRTDTERAGARPRSPAPEPGPAPDHGHRRRGPRHGADRRTRRRMADPRPVRAQKARNF